MKLKKKILIQITAILLVMIIYSSVNVLRLAEEYSQNVPEASNLNMSINKELYSLFNENYETYYPEEYIFCLYGLSQEQKILIYRAENPLVISRSNDSIEYVPCKKEKYGFVMIGTIHSHPNNVCFLSDDDVEIGDEVMGVQCDYDKIVFFTKANNYTTGYYARVEQS